MRPRHLSKAHSYGRLRFPGGGDQGETCQVRVGTWDVGHLGRQRANTVPPGSGGRGPLAARQSLPTGLTLGQSWDCAPGSQRKPGVALGARESRGHPSEPEKAGGARGSQRKPGAALRARESRSHPSEPEKAGGTPQSQRKPGVAEPLCAGTPFSAWVAAPSPTDSDISPASELSRHKTLQPAQPGCPTYTAHRAGRCQTPQHRTGHLGLAQLQGLATPPLLGSAASAGAPATPQAPGLELGARLLHQSRCRGVCRPAVRHRPCPRPAVRCPGDSSALCGVRHSRSLFFPGPHRTAARRPTHTGNLLGASRRPLGSWNYLKRPGKT